MTTTSTDYQTQNYPIPNPPAGLYGTQTLSPASSLSPTSPRLNDYIRHQAPNPYKQLRPLKSPLYIPAVLRPTEHFSTGPATPPKSQHGSLDSLQEAEAVAQEAQIQADLDAFAQSWIPEESQHEVTGPPTQAHWKPDAASSTCDNPHCNANFNLFIRKHHCRHCGHIFCSSHVTRSVLLDQAAQFHPNGISSRACEVCFRQYQRWDTARSLRRKNSENTKDEDGTSGPPTPLAGTGAHRRIISGGGLKGQQQDSIANSVPRDWAWSTF